MLASLGMKDKGLTPKSLTLDPLEQVTQTNMAWSWLPERFGHTVQEVLTPSTSTPNCPGTDDLPFALKCKP